MKYFIISMILLLTGCNINLKKKETYSTIIIGDKDTLKNVSSRNWHILDGVLYLNKNNTEIKSNHYKIIENQ